MVAGLKGSRYHSDRVFRETGSLHHWPGGERVARRTKSFLRTIKCSETCPLFVPAGLSVGDFADSLKKVVRHSVIEDCCLHFEGVLRRVGFMILAGI